MNQYFASWQISKVKNSTGNLVKILCFFCPDRNRDFDLDWLTAETRARNPLLVLSTFGIWDTGFT